MSNLNFHLILLLGLASLIPISSLECYSCTAKATNCASNSCTTNRTCVKITAEVKGEKQVIKDCYEKVSEKISSSAQVPTTIGCEIADYPPLYGTICSCNGLSFCNDGSGLKASLSIFIFLNFAFFLY